MCQIFVVCFIHITLMLYLYKQCSTVTPFGPQHLKFSIFFHILSRHKFKCVVTTLRTLVYVFNMVRVLSSYFLPRMFEPSCYLNVFIMICIFICTANLQHFHVVLMKMHLSFFFFEEKTLFFSGWRLGWDLGRWGLDIVSILM